MKNKENGVKDFLYDIQKEKLKKEKDKFIKDVEDNRRNILNLKILVGVDISGSITPEQFKIFMQQLDLIRGLSVVKVIEIDTKITAMYDYYIGQNAKICRLQGGGGTEFHDAFEEAKKIKPDAILFMTDGDVFDSVKDPKIPTGWILTHDGVHPYGFGKVITKLPSE